MSGPFNDNSLTPRVSVIIAAFGAHRTIERCLESLRVQTFRDVEVILVDSSPGEETVRIAEAFPEVRLERSASRLYPHEARNRAASQARGELLVSIDADVYPHPNWLATLVAEHEAGAEVVVGAIAPHGRRLLDLGIHFCKFAKFLPAGESRAIDTAPTANLLLRRDDFARVGGMRGDRYVADVALGRALETLGRRLRFAPRAVVDHHHTSSLAVFLRERWARGRIYGELRASWLQPRSVAFYLLVSILPIRLTRIAALTFRHCAAAGMAGAFLVTWPIVLAGHAAWLAGESLAYVEVLLRALARRPRMRNSGADVERTMRCGPQ
ncbi:MAG TPA: glycosyltransferase family 2 protein [Thermoanaerobaculia bacterium]|jgi:glycosyltransferase involved in cell wall biosynthesis